MSFGGLKDRHAATVQHFTVYRGPARNLKLDRIAVAYLGRLPRPYTSADIRANGFGVTLRDLDAAAVARAEAGVEEVRGVGVPNYFDDQRFGSVDDSNEFVGREMVLGRFEAALKLALAAPYEHDRGEAEAREGSSSGSLGRLAAVANRACPLATPATSPTSWPAGRATSAGRSAGCARN